MDTEYLKFPDPLYGDKSGLIAVGGIINSKWLLEAYSCGIFPWYNEEDPILWWSPDPRAVVKPGEVNFPKSMRTYFNNEIFELKIDHSFMEVITNCKEINRKDQAGTWINTETIKEYTKLHQLGFAHSFETWKDGVLVGGLYGVSLGRFFFGESMFSKISDASKFAFINLSEILKKNNFLLIDCQIPNDHLMSMGVKIISRKNFLTLLASNDQKKTIIGNWDMLLKR